MKLGLFALVALLGACASLPVEHEKAPSTALAPVEDTKDLKAVSTEVARHGEESGFRLLMQGAHALLSRVVLADRATHSIDLQYYIYRNDPTGKLLSQRLLAAADRGVRVRMLLDDLGLDDQLKMLYALDSHPNLEVRLFNPFAKRDRGVLSVTTQFLVDGSRLNRRMHNKLFVADGAVAVLGGRNVGDEYFSHSDAVNFRDLDVLAIGPVVAETSSSFDRYWNSEAAYPIGAFETKEGDPAADLVALREELKAHARSFRESDYAKAVIAELPPDSATDRLKLWNWGKASLLVDQPEKVDPDRENVEMPILPALRGMVGSAEREVLVISPYFIPAAAGIELLTGLARRGVDTHVLTNSLASNDVPAVHSGYAPTRERLLRGGVKLHELKPAPEGDRDTGRGLTGSSSGLSLHAKALVVDRRYAFVGSVNLDPRSKLLNTEIGVLVDSPALAEAIAAFFADASAPVHSYQVVLAETVGGTAKSMPLRWIDGEGVGAKTWKHEPETSRIKRRRAELARLLPIEGLL